MVKDTIALSKLKNRLDNKPTQINNSSLPAGSPMYFYCRMCGHQSDCLPESYTSSPNRHCGPCKELIDANPGVTPSTLIELANKSTADGQ